MKNKNVLVTGGAGFIGSNLVKELLEIGYKVRVLDNFMSGFRENLKPFPRAYVIEGDIRNRFDVESAMEGIDIVFHMAASVGVKRGFEYPILDGDINVLGTIQLLESAKNHKVKKIVTSSSAGIYGELKTLPINEDHPTNPDSQYGCTKLCEEKLTLCYGRMYNIETICLRYFNVFGENQYTDAYGSVIPIFVFNGIWNKPITINGDGDQTRDFVHVKDVVQANILAAESVGVVGSFNVASGRQISINKLTDIISKNFENLEIRHGDERIGDAKHSFGDTSLIQNVLGYSPKTDLEKDIKNYVDWAKFVSQR